MATLVLCLLCSGCLYGSPIDLSYSLCLGVYEGGYGSKISPRAEACMLIDPTEDVEWIEEVEEKDGS